MEVVKEGLFQVLPAADGVFRQTVQPVRSWSVEFEREVLDGVKIIATGHMNMEKKVLNPYRGVYCAMIWLDVHGFKPFREFKFHYFISEAEGVCGASISGQVVT